MRRLKILTSTLIVAAASVATSSALGDDAMMMSAAGEAAPAATQEVPAEAQTQVQPAPAGPSSTADAEPKEAAALPAAERVLPGAARAAVPESSALPGAAAFHDPAPPSVAGPTLAPVAAPSTVTASEAEAMEAVPAAAPEVAEAARAEKNTPPTPREELRKNLGGGKAKVAARSIVDFQAFKEVSEQELLERGKAVGKATLTNLNPSVNAWFLLSLDTKASKRQEKLHLENGDSRNQRVALAPGGLRLTSAAGEVICDIWSKDFLDDVKKIRDSKNAFGPLCDGRVYLRAKVQGQKTTKEWVVEFLRENVWGGESITSFVKEKLFKDKFLIEGDTTEGGDGSASRHDDSTGPQPATIEKAHENALLEPRELGITAKLEDGKKMLVGRWYENPANKGVFVSAIVPAKIDQTVMRSHTDLVTGLDAVEATGQNYLVAFDMARFDIGFGLGTDHPQVDWSARAMPSMVDRNVGGPDGFGDWEPLVATGMVNPNLSRKVVATFTGGFKRDHGAFKWGTLSNINEGSHYGFIEGGVVFSRMNPGLSTLAVYRDGRVELKTWTVADNERLKDVAFARQNGVAIIENGMPGAQVKNWGAGNWSGSEDSKFRTLRAGICSQRSGNKRYLIYGYFSSATPSVMARVFQAYNCDYAMHLDMNALEHTYLSVFPTDGKNITAEHLVNGMKAVDKSFKDHSIPRFIGFPDNRDFFYLWRK